ncbi:MAG: ImmA/IrrE family metallo-endopeptidase [Kofleriaceae bacterium]
MRIEGIREARRTARTLLHRFGVTAAEHVRIEAFAKRLGAKIVEAPLDGADAQLTRKGEAATITVSDRIDDPASRKFAIAHELGHLVLKHPTLPPHESQTLGSEDRLLETEANVFASELLMPASLIAAWCKNAPATLDVPWRISETFGTSILASARRFTELSRARCAAVFCADGRVVWVHRSFRFDRSIQRGRALDPGSLAYDYYAHGGLERDALPVPEDAWLDAPTTAMLIEHAVASPLHATVLSMLWVPERHHSAGMQMSNP